ncbi:ferric-dicitrate binding protein FerR (iron transport regulator) [Flavobacterium sp. HSC-32F16]|uniref:FecR family protein n=1 Tax=Flavobacterium sp. HSC-32F16 TaxID=2910964 RepID=UPI0020A45254|nr:FecR family protein [Flavobacterium sp. HSC-32F16]MCP2028407.1 ferric-dicitrate binding protein FerR (iron transport regulator) [Flavobacterium sp. HSC-32F16]
MEFKLIIKKINDTLTPEEESVFTVWYNESDANREYFKRVQNNYQSDIKEINLDNAWKIIDKNSTLQKSNKSYYKYAIAASAALLIGIAYFSQTKSTIHTLETKTENAVVEKNSDDIILTLSDGSKVVLNDKKNGVVANQENVVITKDQDGQIRYDENSKDHKGKVSYNTLVTPNGKTFQIALPDGTSVWMNAGSSLKYPTYFEGNDRTVVLTGEAYFEVAHNAKMPFKVFSNGQEVEVLGTHFNVRAYQNEPVFKTTLLEGKIKITEGDNSSLVKPGQQIVVSPDKHSMKTKEVNAELAIAWKNRLFYFENARYDEIMREIERWYDVDVIYKGKIPDERFEGAIQKDLKLNQVLKMLESNDIHFKISGKEVIVTQ